jgi:hypothetical protein
MTKIDVVKQMVERKRQEYVRACHKLALMIREEEIKTKARIDEINKRAQDKIISITENLETIKSAEVRKAIAIAKDVERVENGFSAIFGKITEEALPVKEPISVEQ